jgi:polar amino acid transport system substrate-binding protein
MKIGRKGIIFLAIVLLIGVLLSACTQQTNDEAKKIVMGLDETFAPMGFRDANGEIVGFDVDLANEMASRNGWDLEFQPIDWSMKETELNAGNIDLIWNGYTITDARKEMVDFSTPYLKNAQVIVVLNDSPIKTIADLKGKAVATQAESSSLDAARAEAGFIESLKDGKLIEYATFNDVFNDLESKRTEAIIVDEVMARYYMNNKGEEGYRVLDEDLGPEEFGIGVRKDDADLLKEINAALEKMKSDGKYDEIYEKWFSVN